MRTCIFCGGRAGSREHLWPQWILDKVKPGQMRGFIGRRRDLKFGREFTVRTICRACNSGWMSDIETANRPILGAMIDDKSCALFEGERTAIAVWALKTAMMMDSVPRADVPLFYTQQERHSLRASAEIPSSTLIWMGRYFGRNDVAAHWSGVNFKYENKKGPSRVATFILGSLALQVMTMHQRFGTVIVTPKKGPWDHLLVETWPCNGVFRVYWPPILAFDDRIPILHVSTLHDRWHVGEELPLI